METTIQTPAEESTMTKYAAIDNEGREIGTYDSRDAAAGACQDAAREADSDGEGYAVEERGQAAATTTYSIQARTPSTPWSDEGSGDTWDTREAAEAAMTKLEPTNDDGDAIEYRIVER